MVYKKNVILNSLDGDDKKGLLSLECNGHTTSGKLRLYNFDSQPQGIVTLGVYHDSVVTKAGLIYLGGMLYSLNLDMDNLPVDFSCCVLNFVGGSPKPILYSSCGIRDRLDETFDKMKDTKSAEEVEKLLDEKEIDYDDNLKKEINDEIDKAMACGGECDDKKECQKCKYKLYYENNFENKNLVLSNEENIEDVEENNDTAQKNNFYQEMKAHLDKIFEEGEEESYLESLIGQSKWVKVKLSKGEYYVVGIIWEDDEIKYICYGVPGVYDKQPPKELSGFPVWFPLDKENPNGFGYWLSYQDAESGESVKAVVV